MKASPRPQADSQTQPQAPQPAQSVSSVSLWQVVKSVAAAFIGIQSDANRQRDFSHGKPWQFIVIGLALTLGFVLMVGLVVKLVLSAAGV